MLSRVCIWERSVLLVPLFSVCDPVIYQKQFFGCSLYRSHILTAPSFCVQFSSLKPLVHPPRCRYLHNLAFQLSLCALVMTFFLKLTYFSMFLKFRTFRLFRPNIFRTLQNF